VNDRDDDVLTALAAADAALPPGPGPTWSPPRLAALAARRTRRRLAGAAAATTVLAAGIWLANVRAPIASADATFLAELQRLRDDFEFAQAGWRAATERALAADHGTTAGLAERLARGALRCDVAAARAAALPAPPLPTEPTKDHR
jgi:hypothetical protein